MANIVIPGSQFDTSLSPSRVKLDSSRLMGQYHGAQAIAGAMNDVGDTLTSIATDMQRAKDAKIVADASLRMSQAHTSLIESFQGDPNNDEWESRAKEMATQVKQDIYTGKDRVSPNLKRQLDISLQGWAGNLQTTAKTAANVQRVQQAWGKSQEAITDAVNNGNLDQAKNVLNLAKSAKLVDPVVAQKMERDFPKQAAIAQIETGAVNNPKKTYDDLNAGKWPALDPKTRARIKVQVGEAMDVAQGKSFKGILADYENDPAHPLDENKLKEKVNSGEITAKMATSYQHTVDRANYKDAEGHAGRLAIEIHNRDFTIDPNYEKTANDYRTEIAHNLPITLQKSLMAEIDNKVNAAKKNEKYVPPHAAGSTAIEQQVKAGNLGPKDPEDPAYMDTMAKARHLETLLEAEMKKRGTMTPDEQGAFISSQVQGTKDESVFGNVDWLKAK